MILLSHVLRESTPLYGNEGSVDLGKSRLIKSGDASNNTNLCFSAHSGTHIDAPFHFDDNGKKMTDFSPDFWFCTNPYLVEIDVKADEVIQLSRALPKLESIPKSTDILLIKTGFELFRESQPSDNSPYIFNNPGISPEIGIWLRKNLNLKMVGFDFISLTSYNNKELGRLSHINFLSSNLEGKLNDPILIVEDMTLKEIDSSPTSIVVAPLFFENADGGPVSVFANM
jgi:kynurenine formamidase